MKIEGYLVGLEDVRLIFTTLCMQGDLEVAGLHHPLYASDRLDILEQ